MIEHEAKSPASQLAPNIRGFGAPISVFHQCGGRAQPDSGRGFPNRSNCWNSISASRCFHRKARSLSLTRVGAAYLPKVKESIELLAEGTEEVFGFRQSELLTVRVTIGFAANWLAPRMIRYYQTPPHASCPAWVSSVWNDEFSKEQFDLDIRYGNRGLARFPDRQADLGRFDAAV